MIRVLLVAILACVAMPACAQNFYWTSAIYGADTNDCKSIATACKTINHAYSLTVPGDFVEVLPGGAYSDTGVAPVNLNHGGNGWSKTTNPNTGITTTNAGGYCNSPVTIEGYALQPGRPVVIGTKGAPLAGGIAQPTITQNGTTFYIPMECLVVQHLEFAGWNNELSFYSIIQNAIASGQSWQNPIYIDYGAELNGAYAATNGNGTAATCNTVAGNAVITCSATNSLPYALYVSGNGIPSGATATIASGTNLTLSANATATSTGVSLTFSAGWYDTTATQTCNTTSGSPTIVCTNTTVLPTAMIVTGNGIAANAIVTVSGPTTVQLTGGTLPSVTATGALIGFTQPTNHIVFNDLYLHDFPGGGLGFQAEDYIAVTKNIITSNAFSNPNEGSGISLYHLTDGDQTLNTIHNVISQNFVSDNFTEVFNRAITYNGQPIINTAAICASSGCTGTFLGVQSFCSDGGTTCGFACSDTNSCPVGISSTINYTMIALDATTACIPANTAITYGGYGTGNSPYVILSQPINCPVNTGDALYFGYGTDGNGIVIDDDCRQQSTPAGVCYNGLSTIYANVATQNGGAGVQCGPNSIGCIIQFNTLYQDQIGIYNYNNSSAPGEIYTPCAYGLTVQNNIVVGGSTVPVIWDASGTPCVGGIGPGGGGTWNNNLFYGGISGNWSHPIPGTANVLSNPLLNNPSATPQFADFRLQATSPAIGAASGVRVADFFGNTVASKDSIGAFAVPPCTGNAIWLAAPAAGSLTTSLGTYCPESTINIVGHGGVQPPLAGGAASLH